ncbi:hypothetical protein [Microbacterium paludicola]|uniref:hypothetical protein n=1 Tax=Microbacterium paludicola TaxID=300019 RepID=UPI0021B4DBA4|nr:hypothetical protein [Microbacterium paludicola]
MMQTPTMVRTEVIIDGEPALLAQDQDVAELKARIEQAVATPGAFVDFVVVGNRRVSALITPRSRVTFSVATVQFDERDTRDEAAPFGGFFDF